MHAIGFYIDMFADKCTSSNQVFRRDFTEHQINKRNGAAISEVGGRQVLTNLVSKNFSQVREMSRNLELTQWWQPCSYIYEET